MYKISYDLDSGRVLGINKEEEANYMFIPVNLLNRDFRKFLKWNKVQKKPLDYETPIAVETQEPVETLEDKIRKIAKEEIKKDKVK